MMIRRPVVLDTFPLVARSFDVHTTVYTLPSYHPYQLRRAHHGIHTLTLGLHTLTLSTCTPRWTDCIP
eukprot:scaffold16652_cov43-Phaeocystis_antarctica.AAC.4